MVPVRLYNYELQEGMKRSRLCRLTRNHHIFALAMMCLGIAAQTCAGQQRLPEVPKPVKLPAVRPSSLPPASPSDQTSDNNTLPPGESGSQARRGYADDALPGRYRVRPKKNVSHLDWWNDKVSGSMLDQPQWVTFDLQTVLLDTLAMSPRIQSVSQRTSVALERIVQQDAAFDPSVLFESQLGRTNDPVGNSLVTGGPPRLIEESLTMRGGVQRTGRRGTEINLGQELGLLDSNSNFFEPQRQANARLSLSLTQPLLVRGGRVYNERLLTQARIDSKVSWQEMRGEVEQRIADVIEAYWTLYELRCHLMQQSELLKRGKRIEDILVARGDFDSSRIEMAKARGRVARRVDRQLQIEAEIQKQQAQLAAIVGSEELAMADGKLEMIPLQSPTAAAIGVSLRDAVLQGIENRPEIRAATAELESAALSIEVTRAELLPELTGIVDTYLQGLNGRYNVAESFTDQFTRGGPGVSAGLQYQLPYGRRAARSRHREAHHLYQQRSEELREAIQLTRAEIETALINANLAHAQQQTKRRLLVTAIEEEAVLSRRWEMMGGDGAAVGTVLENLLDAQQRRTDAEREWTSAQTRYLTSLVELQRAMGTLLMHEGIQPLRNDCDNSIQFIHSAAEQGSVSGPLPQLTPEQFEALIRQEVNP